MSLFKAIYRLLSKILSYWFTVISIIASVFLIIYWFRELLANANMIYFFLTIGIAFLFLGIRVVTRKYVKKFKFYSESRLNRHKSINYLIAFAFAIVISSYIIHDNYPFNYLNNIHIILAPIAVFFIPIVIGAFSLFILFSLLSVIIEHKFNFLIIGEIIEKVAISLSGIIGSFWTGAIVIALFLNITDKNGLDLINNYFSYQNIQTFSRILLGSVFLVMLKILFFDKNDEDLKSIYDQFNERKNKNENLTKI